MEKLNVLPRLNLQFFADGGEDASGQEPATEPIVDNEEQHEETTESAKAEKTFTQADMDELAAKVRREEKAKRERKAEQEREELRKAELEKNEEYKTLLDEAKAEIEQLKAKEVERERAQSIVSKLSAKGLTAEQVERYAKYIHGTTDEEIEASIETVYSDFVVTKEATTGDPSANFGSSKKPEQTSDEDYGRSLYQSIRK